MTPLANIGLILCNFSEFNIFLNDKISVYLATRCTESAALHLV